MQWGFNLWNISQLKAYTALQNRAGGIKEIFLEANNFALRILLKLDKGARKWIWLPQKARWLEFIANYGD